MKTSSNENPEKEKDSFLLQNKLLFKKYHPIKPIGKGTFSTVYLSLNIKTNIYVAIKAEKRSSQSEVELLESEAFLLYSLRGFGIPEVLSYGRTKNHNILVMPLLGESLLDIFILRNVPVNINDICVVGIQILDRIEWVHSNNIVYRDIKPENFLFGKKDKDVLYLIDFGLCRKYKSSKTGKHIKPRNLGKFTGTSRYASVYAMAGNEQSRRDDIESIGYMIIFLMKKKLPWQGIKANSYKECYNKLYLMKKHIKLENLCKGLPIEIFEYMKNAKNLKFEQEPDYKYLKNLFRLILKRNKIVFDKYIFSWCRYDSINTNSMNKKKNSNNKLERKSSPQNRLYKKIQESIENKNKNKSIHIITNLKNIELIGKNKTNHMNYFDNSIRTKNEINSEVSNTMKVMLNKNINSIPSGMNESTEINLSRINSDKNVYNNNNIISFRMNKNLKKSYSPDIKLNNYLSLNPPQVSDINNNDNKNKNNNLVLKKINFPKKVNRNNKIISISPVAADRNNKINNNLNLNNNKNKYNKITQIKVANVRTNNNNNINKNNSNIQSKKNINENIIYNTYNTYNTFNSYNNAIDKPINNNIKINNIYQREPTEIQNYQNYKRIKKKNYENNKIINFRNNIPTIINYIKTGPILEQNFKSQNNNLQNNKLMERMNYNSIDIKPSSISKNISYKKYQNINIAKKKNTSIDKDDNNLVTKILGYNNKKNNGNNYNSNIVKNIIYSNKNNMNNLINNNNINMKNQINYTNHNINREIINSNTTPKFCINIDKRFENENSFNNKMQIINNNNIKEIFDINNNINNKNIIINNQDNVINQNIKMKKMKKDLNTYKKGIINNNNNSNNNKIYENIPKDNYNPYNINNSNFSSLQNYPNNIRRIKRKKQEISYIYKNNKKGVNSLIINNNNHNHILNLPKNNNNSYRNLSQNTIDIKNNYFKNDDYNNNKDGKQYFNKMDQKSFTNHSYKIINTSDNTNNKYYENLLVQNKFINNNNSFYINKYKTEEIDSNDRLSNNYGNKMNRINKYKIIRNRVNQN